MQPLAKGEIIRREHDRIISTMLNNLYFDLSAPNASCL